MKTAVDIFEESLDWLRTNYSAYKFFVERDVVWTLQNHLRNEIERNGVGLKVFNDYGILPGDRRKFSADLALIGIDNKIEVAAEFKYEPSHTRHDIPREKLPVVGWGDEGVAKDIKRIEEFVGSGLVKKAYAILIDEGRYFRPRVAHPNSQWVDWPHGISVLIAISGLITKPSTQKNQW